MKYYQINLFIPDPSFLDHCSMFCNNINIGRRWLNEFINVLVTLFR